MKSSRALIGFAALNGALAVSLGAFAAHGAGPYARTLLQTGSHYQLVHAALAVACGVWTGGGRPAVVSGWLSASGGLVFSLALAAIALLNLPIMGAVAPIGGTLMIAGWLSLAYAALRPQSPTSTNDRKS